MICRGNDDHITWQLIELHKQKRHDPFDFAGFVNVSALLTDSIELVEKKNARRCTRIFEEARQASISFAEVSADQCIVANR